MDKIDKIKAEIELRIAQWSQYTFACASQIASEAIDRVDELKGLLVFIDSMQEDSNCGEFAIIKNEPTAEDIDKVAQELYEHLYELKRRNNVPTNLYEKQEIIDLWKAGVEYAYNHPKVKDSKISEEIDKASDMESYDIEVWNWLKEHGTEENKQLLMMTARHFADWVAELRDKRDTECPVRTTREELEYLQQKSYESGQKDMKEEMMKGAIEANVTLTNEEFGKQTYVELGFRPTHRIYGEKVHIIILKQEDEK